MRKTLKRLWKLGNTPIGELSAETLQGGLEVADKVFELAATLQEQGADNKQIQRLVNQIPTLLDVLNSPWGQVARSALPFVGIAAGLLQLFQKDPSLVECVALVTQSAYLESLRDILQGETALLEKMAEPASVATQKQIRKLGDLELDDYQARLALVYFPESELAQAFNTAVIARLEDAGVDPTEAKNWAEKIASNTPRYIAATLAEAAEKVQQLLAWYKAGGRETFEKYVSIETYLDEAILSLPEEKVFQEEFSFRDIYVPLKAALLDNNGKEIRGAETPLLEDWAKKVLTDEDKRKQVLFIEAAAGRGKTVFCRMFAAWAAKSLHPRLTPILIRLRDIESFEGNFENILSNALMWDFVKNDNGWLTDCNTHFLFILDGFDELRIERGTSGGIKDFIEKVHRFQERAQTPETGHRIMITGRPLALQGITLPPNLERVKLLAMDDDLRQEWFANWQKVVSLQDSQAAATETQSFRDFLQAETCPDAVKNELAREPLLLYLLARMHRDKDIKLAELEGSNATTAKIIIYEKCLASVLREQREEWLQRRITGLKCEDLERILTEAGLCVVQSGGEFAKIPMIETRLEKSDPEAAKFLQTLQDTQGEKGLTTALGAFYLRPAAGDKEGGVEFYHKSFGEFLCAKRLQASLEEWTAEVKVGRRQQLYIDDAQLCQQIYDLLGYGGLTPEIVEYLMGLLRHSDDFKPMKLFERLEDFYWRWCDGEFIDAKETTLPQSKMRELQDQLPEREIYLGQRQVDVYAGLNVMILLLELHRYGKQEGLNIAFYPCGQPDKKGKLTDPRLLSRLMGYGECLGDYGFINVIGHFLSGVNLRNTNLRRADLSGADLSRADLRGADLRRTHLGNADLSSANLSGADLRLAHLSSSRLRGANLSHARLRGVNFSNADLSSANLSGADLSGADLSSANLSSANLSSTNLSDADLIHADLSGANLSSADLSGTDLSSVDLIRVNLSSADLSSVNLSEADLSGINLSDANLSDVDFKYCTWNEGTQWHNAQGLETAKNLPPALKQQLQQQGIL